MCSGESLANEFLVFPRTLDFRSDEEGDTVFDRRANHRDHRLPISCRAVAGTHGHAAEAGGTDLQIPFSEFAFLHNCIPSMSNSFILEQVRRTNTPP
jgi:hypothetical protein